MQPHLHSTIARRLFAILTAAGVTLLSPCLVADPLTHGEDDIFALETARLLPPGPPTLAAIPTPTDRIILGDWTTPIAWTPHIPVSAATLPDGRVLTFASNQRTTFPGGPEFTYAATWNPATGTFVEYNNSFHDMFCGGLVMLPDGRVLVNGGRNTTVLSSIFDWRANTWTKLPNMNDPRWYNTTVALPSGRAYTVSGSGGSSTAERWDASSGWSRLTGIDWNVVLSEPGYINIWHPFLLLARDGRLFHFGPTRTMHWVTPDGSGSIVNAGPVVPGTHYPKEGSWAMYDEGKILVAGGGTNTTANTSDTTTGTSSTTAYTVDLNGASPIVTPAASLNFGRQFANVVVLPTGEVMIMGGNTSGLKFNDTGSVLTPEIWNPTTGQWRLAADMSVPRNYHSLSLLLPDGRVLSGGGGLGGNSADHRDVQLYTPPTLFKADGTLATRPVLSTAPNIIGVATRFIVSGTAGLKKFALIRMAAITHSVNTDLRYLSLPFVETTPGTYQLTARSSPNVMTPGYWMLFGLDAGGVYSVAKILQVDPTSAVLVVAQGNQSSSIGQAVALQMSATGPTGAVLSWSATGLPTGLGINALTGNISGTPTTAGNFTVTVSVTDGNTTDSKTLSWAVQPSSINQNFVNFSGTSALTFNGKAAVYGNVLRLTTNLANQVGSAFLSSPIPVGSDTSFTTRFIFRISGSADGGDGMAFILQGNAATAIGAGGGGLGYGGIAQSLAIEIDNYQGAGDPNANHMGILANGATTTHVATWNATWDLEDGASHTAWVEYDGPANQLRVYAAQGIVTQRPSSPVMTASLDLPAFVGSQAWFGFSAGTGGVFNNQDVESWSLNVNAFGLSAQPVITPPGDQLDVVGNAITRQLQAVDANGDLLTWSASGLPTGLSINPSSGLVTGTPTTLGVFNPVVTVNDGNTAPATATFRWTLNPVLTVQPLTGTTIAAGTTLSLTAQSAGGLNPKYRWSFGDGTSDTSLSSSPSVTHLFVNPGRYLVVVTVRDDTGRELTSSYRQAVAAPLIASKSSSSSSLRYETRSGANARLWVVNPDNDSVTVIDAVTRAKLAEIPVGQAPRTLAIAGDGRVWVVNAGSATITVLKPDYTVSATLPLPRGSRPFGIVFDPSGINAFVALEFGGKVLKLDAATGSVLGSTAVGLNVRHLAMHGNGTRLLATRFVTPPVPGENTASPQTTVNAVNYGGEVVVLDPSTLSTLSVVILAHSEQTDTSNSAHGIPNYLGAAAISPDGQFAWVPSKQDNIKRGTLRSGGSLTHDMSLRSIASRIAIASLSEDLAGRVDYDNASVASAAAFDPSGIFLFTALEGDRQIVVTDSWAKREVLRFDVGRAPQGLALSPDGKTLYVQNFMDRSVTFHDLTSLVNGLEVAPPAPTTVACVATEKLSATVLNGKQIFYDTRDTRVAFQQYISCASCHNDGGQDGRVWDFTQFGEGLRNTITLRGHGGMAQGPLHWTGNFDEVQDFEGQIRNFAAGTGLMSDPLFHAGTRAQPLGDPKAGLSADLDALAAYVSSLTAQGQSPERNTDGTLTPEARAGQLVFVQKNCAACHSGTHYTDSALGVFHDIGTLKASSGQRLGNPLTGLDTPTLRGLWNTAPYLHDGSAATLDAAITAHSGVTLTPTELNDLVAFLRQLDESGADASITGLKGQYFNGLNFEQLALERIDSKVDFDWGTGSPGAGVGADGFTVRWIGRIQPLYSETYTFSAITDDGFRLWINNQLILDSWIDQGATERTAVPIALQAGARYDIKIEYYENGGAAMARLFWSSSSQAKEIVPTSPLSPPAPLTPTLTWAAPAAITYGATLTGSQLNAGASVVGTLSYAPPVGTLLNAGLSQTLSVTFTPLDQVTYSAVTRTVSLDVVKAPLSITALDRTKAYGAPTPALGLSYSGFVNGENATVLDTPAVLSSAVTAASPVGTYPITVSGAIDANYTISFVNGTFTVTGGSLQTTSTNPALISIPDLGIASVYPSVISVSGLSGSVTAIQVKLNSVNHTYPDDLDILLVGPAGQKVILMSDAGGGTDLVNVDFNFDPTAALTLSDAGALSSGTYKPTSFESGDPFPAPAPAGPYSETASDFIGTNPNGAWSLYVVDDASQDLGTIAGGWSLTLTTGGNLAPTISAISDRVVSKGSSAGPIPFTVGDTETPAAALTVVASSSSSTLVPASGIVLGGSGTSRSVTLTPDASLTGTATITVTVTDGNGAFATRLFLLTVVDPSASTTSWANTTVITLPDLGIASVYPSSINVSGISGSLSRVQVKLNQLSHTYPDDLDFLLVGPGGQKILLLSDAGGGADVLNIDLVVDSAATTAMPDSGPLVSGTYKATNFEPGDAFTPPAPSAPYSESLADVIGTNPNGTWSLFVLDDAAIDGGSLAGGWGLVLTTGGNQSPTVSPLSDLSLAKNSSSAPISFTVGDAETPASTLAVTVDSTNPGLVTAAGMVLGGSGASRTLTITPAANQTGSATLTVSVSDGSGGVGKASFLLTVIDLSGTTFTTFNSSTPIVIPDIGAAAPYPSILAVSALSGPITSIQVKLNQVNHTYPDDLDILLVGPGGQKVMLMSDAGGSADLVGVNLVFDPTAASLLGDASAIASGTYLPFDFEPGESLLAPAPVGPYSVALTDFVGTAANGTWSLFVADDAAIDAGSISGGWSLVIGTAAPALAGLAATTVSNPAAQILSVTRDPQGVVALIIQAEAGRWYALEASSDLIQWSQVTSLRSIDGLLHSLDQKAASQSVRFYRVVLTTTPFQ